jgi:hypothetical protein
LRLKKTTSKKVAAPKKEKAEKKEETKASETKAVKNIYSYRVTEKATRLADKKCLRA